MRTTAWKAENVGHLSLRAEELDDFVEHLAQSAW